MKTRTASLLALAFLLLPFHSAPAGLARQEPPAAPAPTQTPTPTPSPSPTPAPTPDEADDVERINTDLTNVLLSATDSKRRFVTTLKAEDLRVLEDGVEQRLISFQQETDAPLALAVLVDTSASQAGVLRDEQEAARAFFASVLRPGKDTGAVVSFTGITRVEQPPTGERERLNAAIDATKVLYPVNSPECEDEDTPEEVRVRCQTAVWDAIAITSGEVLSRTPETARRAIVLLSDGDDYSSKLTIYQSVEHAARNNVVVYSIGIRDRDVGVGDLRKDNLRRVSEETGGRAFFPKNRAELDSAFAQVERELRSQYLLSYSPTNKARDGRYRRVTVEIVNPALRKQKLRLLYRRGYYARGGERPAPAATNDD
ncbi:MAG TPA: VWA domain-containing protein [Pyrinomonadaceae bacterium]|nr:VWA domain-containing protein [Pyrinomonadaceae bacterium]